MMIFIKINNIDTDKILTYIRIWQIEKGVFSADQPTHISWKVPSWRNIDLSVFGQCWKHMIYRICV